MTTGSSLRLVTISIVERVTRTYEAVVSVPDGCDVDATIERWAEVAGDPDGVRGIRCVHDSEDREDFEMDIGDADEADDAITIDIAKWAVAPPPIEPPPDAWVTVRGHRWATNRHIAVREDGPRPAVLPSVRWSTGDRLPSPESFAAMLDKSASDADRPAHGYIDSTYAPLCGGCECRQGPANIQPVCVYRGDDLVALIMPMRSDFGEVPAGSVRFVDGRIGGAA